MATVILAEKPDACARISKALAEKKLKKKMSEFGVNYYEFYRHGKKHIAVAAVGHLFNLKQAKGKWTYPIFDVKWVPSFKARKSSAFSEKYFKTVEAIGKNGSEYIVACDLDTEGSTLAWNIVRFIFEQKDAKRMKFSTLTKADLIKAYEEMSKHLDWKNIEAGLARHHLDFIYGINVSRALMTAIKKASPRFAVLSSGRVQGPILSILAEKELKIKKFVPKPFWQLQLILLINGNTVIASYEKDKIWDEGGAKKIFKSCKDKPAVVDDVNKRKYKQKPPVPFNVTSLQTESYRLFGYSPQQTLRIAQNLYTNAYISYPRTSSEKLPPQIGYRNILEALSKIKKYASLCKKLLGLKELKPVEGKRTDPAHEAIHPTIEPPKDINKLRGPEKKVYDLICRRYFTNFASEAERESMKVTILVNKHKFFATGRRTLERGWMEFYGPYAKFDEIILPDLKKGDKLKTKKLEMLSKETSPPPRYSQASIIKMLEQKNLGTRATRSAILQTLYTRDYVVGKSIVVTSLGLKLAKALKTYVPDFVDEKLTRKFEKELEKIMEGKVKKEKILKEARKALVKICKEFKKHEMKIGKELGKAIIETQENKSLIGPCPNCGKNLKRLFSPRTRKYFVGCSGYKDGCRTGFPLPHNSTVMRLNKICDKCNTPTIRVFRKGKRPFNMCLDPNCETKKDWGKPKKGKRTKKKKKG